MPSMRTESNSDPGAWGKVKTGAHLFSVDVEEYFQVNAFDGFIRREDWPGFPSRVDECAERIMGALEEAGARGTFFVVGWLAKRRPHLVRSIAEAGHEVGSHSFWHRRVTELSPEEFRLDTRESKAVLEDITGQEVQGYRAPTFSILPGMEWAFDVLLEEGFRYDSSRFPIRRPGYGSPGTPKAPHWVRRDSGRLLEIPMATATLAGMTFPAAGGGYLRHLPFGLVDLGFRQAQAAGIPAMFYLHPWEIDEDQPRIRVPLHTRLRHYRGLANTFPRMKRMLKNFSFVSVRDQLESLTLLGERPFS